ncbi:MAG: hypothetical protein CJD30_10515 [Sulfuricurvum sp. PD_MW2]|jgi:predicted ATP-binding protein involved in virulence|uniref:AAA family ATPase n=1 Tax=Sulfuricurvum sp. PD_MW2 TaxID=2027917 RepID=UPI000C05E7FA|nr:AAA family ATPase [Sulfuricurvum sp. PD_MW2]PHM16646.1 MAG: hypothetical protein CJD30_10515 [Sulfuricurvum sp. PD_MW2]
MELVYLWVDNYKNIHQQGFNFSGRYRCDYNPETNELTIDENTDYVHIFPENINVTAIVGKNGSGKSSLIELITYFRTERFTKYVDSFSIAVFFKNNSFYILTPYTNLTHIFNQAKVKIVNLTEHTVNSHDHAHIDIDLTFFANIKFDFTMQSKQHQNYHSGHFNDFYQGGMYYKNNEADDFNIKFVNLIQKENHFFSFLNADYIFDSFEVEFHEDDFLDHVDKQESYYEKLSKLRQKLEFDQIRLEGMTVHDILNEEKNHEKTIAKLRVKTLILSTIISYCIHEIINAINGFRNDIKSVSDMLIDDFLAAFNVVPEVDQKPNSSEFYSYLIASFLACTVIMQKKVFEYQKAFLDWSQQKKGLAYLTHEFDERLEDVMFFLSNKKIIDDLFELFHPIEDEKWSCKTIPLKIGSEEANGMFETLSKNLFFASFYRQGILKINFVHSVNGYSFNHLSNGEKIRLTTFINLAHKFIKSYTIQETSILMFDEIEQSLHPSWQRNFLYDLFSCFRQIENIYELKHPRLHFIFASHSPFMLSDTPSQNIIFLDRDENGKCKVFDGLKNKKQTFGANIHTLLSDAFFMDEGLMGEFAKEKIQSVIDFLNGVNESNLDQQKAWSIIQLIGEPFLKQKLEEKFHEKFSTEEEKRKTKIKQLEDELERLRSAQPEN